MSAVPDLDASGDVVLRARVPLYRRLYVHVLCAIVLGVLVGCFKPDLAQQMKPLGDIFIKLIRMMVEPVIFSTVVVGVARMGSMREVGRVGLKALVYFEVASGLALLLGLLVANVLQPGAGIKIDLSSVDASAVRGMASQKPASAVDFVMHVVPDSVVGAFAQGATLQVVFFSLLLGLGLSTLGDKVRPLIDLLDLASQGLFRVINLIMRLAPIGAFGAMAFTVGKYGLGTLQQLGLLLVGMYLACLLFIFLVLGCVARLAGFSLWRFLRHIRDEILIVFGTSTSESALPALMSKLEALGCDKSIVGLVVPTGYSFNLDGTSLYLSMAVLFVAQCAHVQLSWYEQFGILGLLLLTSKGSAAVTGGGFITLAATLSSIDSLPVAGLTLLFGVDRFMSEARALTNLIGNGVATVAIARWEGSLDRARLRRELDPAP